MCTKNERKKAAAAAADVASTSPREPQDRSAKRLEETSVQQCAELVARAATVGLARVELAAKE